MWLVFLFQCTSMGYWLAFLSSSKCKFWVWLLRKAIDRKCTHWSLIINLNYESNSNVFCLSFTKVLNVPLNPDSLMDEVRFALFIFSHLFDPLKYTPSFHLWQFAVISCCSLLKVCLTLWGRKQKYDPTSQDHISWYNTISFAKRKRPNNRSR